MSADLAQPASRGGICGGRAEPQPHPLAHDVRAGSQVAQPLAARVQQRTEERRGRR